MPTPERIRPAGERWRGGQGDLTFTARLSQKGQFSMCEQVVAKYPVPVPGSIWRHWKGGLYRVICVAVRESDGREMVVYEPADGSGHAWARDSIQWHMRITPKEGEQVPRFSLVEPAEAHAEPVEFEDTKPAGRPVEERGPEY